MGYPPLRLFFQTRNRIIVHNEYKCFGLSDLSPSWLWYAKLVSKIVLFEDKKIRKIKAILLGFLCGKFPRTKFDEWIVKKQFYM
jgi:hypothetical protein